LPATWVRVAVLSLVSTWLLSFAVASPSAASEGFRPRLDFTLTILGDVPKAPIFGIYVQTDPPTPDVQTHYWICPAGGPVPTYTCASGETSSFSFTYDRVPDDVEVTFVFRYDRHVGDADGPARWPQEWESFYEGRVTLSAARPTASFHMTYNYNLGVPDTAAPAQDGSPPPPVLPFVTGVLVLVLGVTMEGLFRRRHQE
jgi:hypothetical protein